MSTSLQRQKQREEEEINAVISRMRQPKPQNRWIADEAARVRMQAQMTPATQAQLAIIARQLEIIRNPDQVHTPEKPADKLTERAISLVDVMQKEGLLPFDLHRAAETFRELFFEALGPSKGISSYGEYAAASEPSKRLPTSDRQMQAYNDLKRASLAAFGVSRKDGRYAIDEQLMQLVVPAILSDKKVVTQGTIGQQRTRYVGRAQVNAAGGVVVYEVLQKLSLHFQFRER